MNQISRRELMIGALALPLVPSLTFATAQPGAVKPRILLIGYTSKDPDVASAVGPTPLWGDLDVEKMATALSLRLGAKAEEMHRLVGPKQVTKQQILATLRSKIIAGVTPDTPVVIYFSGHGVSYYDPGKKSTSQGLIMSDSLLVPTERDGFSVSAIDSNTLLRGPEIAQVLDELRQAGARNVTLIVDSCHSGGTARGNLVAMSGSGLPATDHTSDGQSLSMALQAEKVGFVSLMACAESEAAYAEVGKGGRFTEALTKALGEDHQNYEALARAAAFHTFASVGPKQSPALFGDGDRVPFGRTFLPLPESFSLLQFEGKQYVNAGEFLGIRRGYVFGAFVAGSAEPMARFEVATVEARRSEIKLTEGSLPSSGIDKLQLRVIDGFSESLSRVKLDGTVPPAMPEGFVAELAKERFLDLRADGPVDYLLRAGGKKGVLLVDAQERILDDLQPDTATVILALRQRAKARILAEIKPSKDQPFRLEAQFVEVKGRSRSTPDAQDAEPTGFGKVIGDTAQLSWKNMYAIQVRAVKVDSEAEVKDRVFVTAISVLPNGTAEEFWPKNQLERLGSNQLPVNGEWYYLGYDGVPFAVGFGDADYFTCRDTELTDAIESVFLFATPDPLDVGFLTDTGGRRGAAPRNGLERAFQAMGQGRSRSGDAPGMASWNVTTLTIRTVPT